MHALSWTVMKRKFFYSSILVDGRQICWWRKLGIFLALVWLNQFPFKGLSAVWDSILFLAVPLFVIYFLFVHQDGAAIRMQRLVRRFLARRRLRSVSLSKTSNVLSGPCIQLFYSGLLLPVVTVRPACCRISTGTGCPGEPLLPVISAINVFPHTWFCKILACLKPLISVFYKKCFLQKSCFCQSWGPLGKGDYSCEFTTKTTSWF